jgi:hypothetical protein
MQKYSAEFIIGVGHFDNDIDISFVCVVQRLFHRRYHFHDTNISPWVQSAFHAIAIHEQREWFQPVLMKYAETPYCEQELVQRWFPGFHQDVSQKNIAYEARMSKQAYLFLACSLTI